MDAYGSRPVWMKAKTKGELNALLFCLMHVLDVNSICTVALTSTSPAVMLVPAEASAL